MQMQVAAADVDDERHRRPDGGDIGKILFGADAQIGAPGPRQAHQFRNDALRIELIRDEVVGAEVPVRLRQLCDELEELRSAQANRKAVGRSLRCRGNGLCPDDRRQYQQRDRKQRASGH